MKLSIILSVFAFLSTCFISEASAQTTKCDSVYTLAQQMPVYGKGQNEFFSYLNKNLEVKKPCKASDLKRIIFTVTTEGKITDIEIFGVSAKCKDDLIKQLQQFPDWTPGKNEGVPVCVQIILPIQLKEHAN